MLEIGSTIGGMYKILHEVGRGGMSVVYMALNEKANRRWAVKVVRKDGNNSSIVKEQRLAAEIEILKNLDHKYLPKIANVIENDDNIIIIMDYVEGNSLEKALEERGALPQEDVIEWGKQLCEVLDYLHNLEKPIIYRDMKPANVMLRPDNTVALIDFGTAREYKVDSNKDTISLGTIGYAAPEQYANADAGQTDARTDIYSLGVTLHHLLTGNDPTKPPYDLLPIRQINGSLSAGLEKIIIKCTQRSPEKRYQSAAELLYDLENFTTVDEEYRKKQVGKLAAFIGTAALSVALAVTSLTCLGASRSKLGENYEYQLLSADSVEGYYSAILTDPSRVEAYEQLNAYLGVDAKLTSEEGKALSQLLVGLPSRNSNGYNTNVQVLPQLQAANSDGYQKVCFDYGWSFAAHYDGDDESRYSNAAKWFEFIRNENTEDGRTADLFCQISEVTTQIKQLQTSKLTEVAALREKREALWNLVQTLYTASDSYSEARRLETWMVIDSLIQKYTYDFLEGADPVALEDMINQIQTRSKDSLNNPDVAHLAESLIESTTQTIVRVQSAQG